MSERRIEIKTSRTAQWTCVSRAASSLESNPHYRSDDHIARLLVPAFLGHFLRVPLVRRFYRRFMAPKGIYEYTIARTKYIDAVFREALSQDLDQVLIFGAGFDTRALRFAAAAGNTRFFELDVPITQQAKLGQYRRRGLRLPPNATFIAIDFDKESLPDKLDQADFERNRKSLFVLEGLLMYLQPESVDGTFQVIGRFAGPGSRVVFDAVHAAVLRQPESYYGGKEIAETVAKAGEKWHFGIQEGELEAFLSSYGLTAIDQKDAPALERTYFAGARCINGTHFLVTAVKPAGA